MIIKRLTWFLEYFFPDIILNIKFKKIIEIISTLAIWDFYFECYYFGRKYIFLEKMHTFFYCFFQISKVVVIVGVVVVKVLVAE